MIDVRYLQLSHAWPMPQSSLMCAFTATADRKQQFSIASHELLDGDWFSREEVQEAYSRTRANPTLRGEVRGGLFVGSSSFLQSMLD